MTAIRGAAAAVAGTASGIGRALALELAARGCDLALADRDEAGLQTLSAEIGRDAGRKVTVHGVDVSAPQQIEDFARAAIVAQHQTIHHTQGRLPKSSLESDLLLKGNP
jgi:short-subunit dehydrogenase